MVSRVGSTSIIKDDIMAAILAIWSIKFVNFEVLNTAFNTLLPKVDSVECPKDFWPISLVHSFAKLVTKLLANRLAKPAATIGVSQPKRFH